MHVWSSRAVVRSPRRPPREGRKNEHCGRRRKKRAKFWTPHPTLRGPHPSGPPPFGAPHPSPPTLRGPTLWGPHPSGPPTLRGLTLQGGAPPFGVWAQRGLPRPCPEWRDSWGKRLKHQFGPKSAWPKSEFWPKSVN